MTTEELTWLGRQAQERRTIVEVGSYLGRTTKMLALTPGVVHSVDNLVGVGDEPRRRGWQIDAEFRKNLASEIESGKVQVVKADSVEAAQLFEDGSVDMVFIDADHSHPAPKNDIEAWLPKLAPGGLMCGHDAGFRGVKKALAQYPHELVVDGIWKLT